jgi:uncharacterized protein (TIGR03083 family)
MAGDPVNSMIRGTYLALADLADMLSPQRWDSSSLCEGWRIREVVAHLTMPARYSEGAFMAELREDAFDFTLLSNRLATRDASLPTDELVRSLREKRLHEWTPPGGGTRGAHNHAVVHSLDISVPLHERRVASDAAMRVVLDDLSAGGVHAHFGTEIQGRSLRATDIDWSYGSGSELAGPAADLVLHLCGHTVPGSALEGQPLARPS